MAVVAVDGGDELRSGCARERARGREGEQRVREREQGLRASPWRW